MSVNDFNVKTKTHFVRTNLVSKAEKFVHQTANPKKRKWKRQLDFEANLIEREQAKKRLKTDTGVKG